MGESERERQFLVATLRNNISAKTSSPFCKQTELIKPEVLWVSLHIIHQLLTNNTTKMTILRILSFDIHQTGHSIITQGWGKTWIWLEL